MFRDRKDAGQRLMDLVSQYDHEIDLVLAIPRGGVEVAVSIAQNLGKPLCLISAKKVGSPHNPEVAIGAIAPDGSTWFSNELIERLDISQDQLLELSQNAVRNQEATRRAYGNEVNLEEVAHKGVLIVDDGAATGATILASIEALRRAGANPVGVAVPVAAIEVVSIMEDRADFFLALETPSDLIAVGQYYENFGDVSDEAVQQILGK